MDKRCFFRIFAPKIIILIACTKELLFLILARKPLN